MTKNTCKKLGVKPAFSPEQDHSESSVSDTEKGEYQIKISFLRKPGLGSNSQISSRRLHC